MTGPGFALCVGLGLEGRVSFEDLTSSGNHSASMAARLLRMETFIVLATINRAY